MIIFLDARGNIIVPSAPEPVGRNSNDANVIYIVAPFSQAAQLYLTFTLPSGEVLFGNLADPTAPPDDAAAAASYLFTVPSGSLSVWRYLVRSSVTRLAGTVQYTIVTVTESMRATDTGTFPVSRGNKITLPDDPNPDVWQSVLERLSEISQDYIEVIQSLDNIGQSVNANTDAIDQLNGTIYGEGGTPADPAEGSLAARVADAERRLNEIKIYTGETTPIEPEEPEPETYRLSGNYILNSILTFGDPDEDIIEVVDFNCDVAVLCEFFVDNFSQRVSFLAETDKRFMVYEDGKWNEEYYRYVSFNADTPVSKEFYDWFTANASINNIGGTP